jgi:hypothetical protein
MAMKAALGFCSGLPRLGLGRLINADPATAQAQRICTGTVVGWGLFKEALVEQKQEFPPKWEGVEETYGDADVAQTLHAGKVDYEPLGKERAQSFSLITCAVIFGIVATLSLLFAFFTMDSGLVRTALACVTIGLITVIRSFGK